MGAEDYKKEIISMLEDVTDIQCLKLIYGATDTQIKQNFNNNEKHFEEGKHYFLLKGEELKDFKRLVENFDLPFVEALKFTSQLANCIREIAVAP